MPQYHQRNWHLFALARYLSAVACASWHPSSDVVYCIIKIIVCSAGYPSPWLHHDNILLALSIQSCYVSYTAKFSYRCFIQPAKLLNRVLIKIVPVDISPVLRGAYYPMGVKKHNFLHSCSLLLYVQPDLIFTTIGESHTLLFMYKTVVLCSYLQWYKQYYLSYLQLSHDSFSDRPLLLKCLSLFFKYCYSNSIDCFIYHACVT